METINFIDFKDYILRKNPTVIICNDENNRGYIRGAKHHTYSIDEPLFMSLTFKSMLVLCNPNRIVLGCESGNIYFKNIYKIQIEENTCLLGDIIDIYCNSNDDKIVYTLIIR